MNAPNASHLERPVTQAPSFSVEDAFEPHYRREGYVILRDLFPRAAVEAARTSILTLFTQHLEQRDVADPTCLTRHYTRNAERWRQAARRMGDLLPVHHLLAAPRLDQVLNRIGIHRPMLSTPPEIRTDMPQDERYRQPWHQDWRYGQASADAVTLWIPLHDVTAHEGTIQVVPRTHLLGALPVEERTDPRRFVLQDAAAMDGAAIDVPVQAGECVLFSHLLVHQSGNNRSGQARMTAQLRFTNPMEPGFARNGLPKPTDSRLLWDTPPTAEDAARIFGGAT